MLHLYSPASTLVAIRFNFSLLTDLSDGIRAQTSFRQSLKFTSLPVTHECYNMQPEVTTGLCHFIAKANDATKLRPSSRFDF